MAFDQTALAASAARTLVRRALTDDIATNRTLIGAHVNGRLVNLPTFHTPFLCETSARRGLVRMSDLDGLRILRRSTAHGAAGAVHRLSPGTKLTIGPAVDEADGREADPRSRDLDKDLGAPRLAARRAAASKPAGSPVSASGS
ncbi:hypothetical protein [Sorangium sp. So ce1000]|uniref:hypothetical protein n=1 Tax=Sorangium sp. So ce1000 TaxID=3133325 RepID=UPI003F5EDEDF